LADKTGAAGAPTSGGTKYCAAANTAVTTSDGTKIDNVCARSQLQTDAAIAAISGMPVIGRSTGSTIASYDIAGVAFEEPAGQNRAIAASTAAAAAAPS
jgi:hypothetical protein